MHTYRRTLLVSLATLALLVAHWPPASARAQEADSRPRRIVPQSESEEDGDAPLELRSDLVTLTVSVADKNGRPVTGLRPDDFRVREDGRPQKIEHFEVTGDPYALLLVLDTSGSTASQVDALRTAAAQFARGLGPDDRLAVVSFSRDIEILGDLTNDRAMLERQIRSVATKQGRGARFDSSTGTSFYDATYLACLESPLTELENTVRRAVIILSDCVDSTSQYSFKEVLDAVERSGISVYVLQFNTQSFSDNLVTRPSGDRGRINFSESQLQRFYDTYYPTSASRERDPDRYTTIERLEINRGLYEIGRDEGRRLAERTGGRLYPVETLADLPNAYDAITAELRTRYSLGYYPTNTRHDGSWRSLRVEVPRAASAVVTSRPGYWAPRK